MIAGWGVGLRTLWKTRGWTASVTGSLALGIGMSAAIFSVVHGVLLQPPPYAEPERIVALWTTKPDATRFHVGAALWLAWRERASTVGEIGLTRPLASFNLTGGGPPERLQGARMTANVPAVLGARPALGRLFTREEEAADARVALLAHSLWARRFGSDPGIVGRKIQLNGEAFEVVGVMPASYRYPSADFELWSPLYIPPAEIKHGATHQFLAIARLKPGVTVSQANQEFAAIMKGIVSEQAAYRGDDGAMGSRVEPLAASETWRFRGNLYALLAAAGCLMLAGCLNLAVLLVARGAARSRDMAVRKALGATGAGLASQVLTEAIPLGIAGSAAGIACAWWILAAARPLLPPGMPGVNEIALHGPVIAFAVALGLATVVLASVAPALAAARNQPADAMRRTSRSVGGGGRARDILVVAQIALALLLVFSGLLFARSFTAVARVDPGFRAEGTLTMHLAVPRAKYRSDAEVAAYWERIRSAAASIPGVEAAGIVNRLPLSGVPRNGGVEFEGMPEATRLADWRSATPGYAAAMGIPLRRGRWFTEADRAGAEPTGAIDDRLAREVFGTSDPTGRRFRGTVAGTPGPWTTIAGVVGHVRNDSLEDDPRAQVYWPLAQSTQDRGALVMRVTGEPASYTRAAIAKIRGEDPDQAVYDVRSMTEWIDRSTQSRRLVTGLGAAFAIASLLLACLGLYGVVSYGAGLRAREFGLRVALGASPGSVSRLVLAHAAKLAGAGAVLGLLLSAVAARFVETLIHGVPANDPVSLAAAPAVLAAVALLAALAPAWRASRADPAVTLRDG